MTRIARSRRAMSRVGTGLALAVALVILIPAVAEANYGKTTTNAANSIAASVVSAPVSPTAAPSGNNVSLGWTSPNNQNSNGDRVVALSNGTSASCSTVEGNYSIAVSNGPLAANTAAAVTDTGRGSGGTPSGANAGNYFCYRIESTYAKSTPGAATASWFSVGVTPLAAQVGFVVSSITLGNNTGSATCGTFTQGTPGKLDCNDQIVLTFNQPIDSNKVPPSTDTVCAFSKTTGGSTSQAVNIASTTASGDCGTGETVDVGTFNSPTVQSASNSRFNATYALSNGNKTLTITIGQGVKSSLGAPITASGTTLAPSSGLIATPTTAGGVPLCNGSVAGSHCTPTISGSF